jgi:4-oxalocrotonate tautomerase
VIRISDFISNLFFAATLAANTRYRGPTMPFVNVKLVDGVFTSKEKHALAAALTDVMVKFEGSEAFREVVWVLIEELHTDGWHIGGRPFEGPASLMEHLSRSKEAYLAIDGQPASRAEFAEQLPDKAK